MLLGFVIGSATRDAFSDHPHPYKTRRLRYGIFSLTRSDGMRFLMLRPRLPVRRKKRLTPDPFSRLRALFLTVRAMQTRLVSKIQTNCEHEDRMILRIKDRGCEAQVLVGESDQHTVLKVEFGLVVFCPLYDQPHAQPVEGIKR